MTAAAFQRVVPVFSIFDIAKAREFYCEFLGCQVDWEHRHGDDFPLYMQVSRGDLVLHLSEHFGDATPGSTACVFMSGLRELQAELIAKAYRFMKPGLTETDGRLECTVTDPFGNRLRFMQVLA